MDFLKSILPDDWYLKWFPPEEDSQEGVQLYLHIREGKYIIPIVKGLTRSQVVCFLKEINGNGYKTESEDLDEPENVLNDELPNYFDLQVENINKMIWDTFNGIEIVFVGGGELTVEHTKSEKNQIWETWFSKEYCNKEKRIACISTSKLVNW